MQSATHHPGHQTQDDRLALQASALKQLVELSGGGAPPPGPSGVDQPGQASQGGPMLWQAALAGSSEPAMDMLKRLSSVQNAAADTDATLPAADRAALQPNEVAPVQQKPQEAAGKAQQTQGGSVAGLWGNPSVSAAHWDFAAAACGLLGQHAPSSAQAANGSHQSATAAPPQASADYSAAPTAAPGAGPPAHSQHHQHPLSAVHGQQQQQGQPQGQPAQPPNQAAAGPYRHSYGYDMPPHGHYPPPSHAYYPPHPAYIHHPSYPASCYPPHPSAYHHPSAQYGPPHHPRYPPYYYAPHYYPQQQHHPGMPMHPAGQAHAQMSLSGQEPAGDAAQGLNGSGGGMAGARGSDGGSGSADCAVDDVDVEALITLRSSHPGSSSNSNPQAGKHSVAGAAAAGEGAAGGGAQGAGVMGWPGPGPGGRGGWGPMAPPMPPPHGWHMDTYHHHAAMAPTGPGPHGWVPSHTGMPGGSDPRDPWGNGALGHPHPAYGVPPPHLAGGGRRSSPPTTWVPATGPRRTVSAELPDWLARSDLPGGGGRAGAAAGQPPHSSDHDPNSAQLAPTFVSRRTQRLKKRNSMDLPGSGSGNGTTHTSSGGEHQQDDGDEAEGRLRLSKRPNSNGSGGGGQISHLVAVAAAAAAAPRALPAQPPLDMDFDLENTLLPSRRAAGAGTSGRQVVLPKRYQDTIITLECPKAAPLPPPKRGMHGPASTAAPSQDGAAPLLADGGPGAPPRQQQQQAAGAPGPRPQGGPMPPGGSSNNPNFAPVFVMKGNRLPPSAAAWQAATAAGMAPGGPAPARMPPSRAAFAAAAAGAGVAPGRGRQPGAGGAGHPANAALYGEDDAEEEDAEEEEFDDEGDEEYSDGPQRGSRAMDMLAAAARAPAGPGAVGAAVAAAAAARTASAANALGAAARKRKRPSAGEEGPAGNRPEPRKRKARDPATISKVIINCCIIIRMVSDQLVYEKEIRNALGNNPDTSKALRLLVVQGKLVRNGVGGRGNPFSYRCTPLGLATLAKILAAAEEGEDPLQPNSRQQKLAVAAPAAQPGAAQPQQPAALAAAQ